MRFYIEKDILSKHLRAVTGILDRNPTNPILNLITLELTREQLVMVGTNTTTSVKTTITGLEKVFLEGDIAVDGKTFNDAVSKTYGTIEIIVENNLMEIKCGKAIYKIHTSNIANYPNINFNLGEEFKINGNDFSREPEKVISSVAISATRPMLMGVNLKAKDNVIAFTATDSYRLSKSYLEIDEPVEFDITIHSVALREIMKLAKDNDIYVSFNLSQLMVRIKDSETIFATRLIDGVYPETDRLIPTGFETNVEIDRQELLDGINRSSFIKEDNVWLIKFTIQNNLFVLETNAQGVGSTYDELAITKTGNDLVIGINGNYLLDAIKVMENFTININFAGELKPIIVSDGTKQVQLLLPVRMHD